MTDHAVYTCPTCNVKHYGRCILDPQPDSECRQCFDAKQPEEFSSEDYIRCPKCGQLEGDLWERALEDGENTVECGDCGHEYVIEVTITVTYDSPAMEGSGE